MTPVFDLGRLRPIMKAVGSAALALCLSDLLLRAVFGAHPVGVPPPFDAAALTRFYGRVAAFEVMRAAGGVSDEHLVAVVGMSSAKADLEPAILGANDPLRRKWMVLGAEGRNFTQVSLYSRTLLAGQLNPRLVVLAVHPFMLRATDRDTWTEEFAPFAHLRHAQRRLLVNDFFWLGRNQYTLEDLANFLVDRGAEWVRIGFHLPVHRWYPIDSRPWDSWNKYFEPKAQDSTVADERKGYLAELTPEQFDAGNGQPQALRKLVQQFRSRGAKVACVLMPESSQLRSLYPSIIDSRISQAVANASTPQDPVRLVDLRDSMPDDVFYDLSHLNAEGRLRLSTMLGTRLDDQ